MSSGEEVVYAQGASTPSLAYSLAFHRYSELSKDSSMVDYISTSSTRGMDAMFAGSLDFAGSDIPLSPEQRLVNPDISELMSAIGFISVMLRS
jgi:ABC-type phosphate transport system substrate-binding protein